MEHSGLLVQFLTAGVVSTVACGGAVPPFFDRFVIASHKAMKMNCYPCLARLADGRLMIVWSANAGKGNKVVGAVSTAAGRAWSEPVTLIQTPGGRDYDPSLVVSGNRVFVTSTTLPQEGGIHTSTTWCIRSDDSGRTWSERYTIPMNHRYTCGKTHHGLRLKSGTLLMGYSWDVLCEQGKTLSSEGQMHLRAGVMRSTDNGETWQNGGDTDAAYDKVTDGAVLGTDEPAIAELDDGSIYMLMRTGSPHLYEARSDDEGKTWTGIRPSPLRGTNAPAALCSFQVGERRGIMAVWDNARTRFPLCAAASFDGGATWSKPRDIAGPTDGRQASYPGCEQAADGTLVAVWQQDVPGGRDVRCARFSLDWLLHNPDRELQRQLDRVTLPRPVGQAKGYTGGDPAGASPSWAVHRDGGTLTADGALRLVPMGGYYIDNQPGVWDGTKDKLVEFRMRVLTRQKGGENHSAAEVWIGGPEPDTSCQLLLREDAVAFDASYDPFYRIDGTEFHTYRLFTDLAVGRAYLFVDDAKTPVLATELGAPYGYSINRVLFGDSGSASDVDGTSEWGSIRWRDVRKGQ